MSTKGERLYKVAGCAMILGAVLRIMIAKARGVPLVGTPLIEFAVELALAIFLLAPQRRKAD